MSLLARAGVFDISIRFAIRFWTCYRNNTWIIYAPDLVLEHKALLVSCPGSGQTRPGVTQRQERGERMKRFAAVFAIGLSALLLGLGWTGLSLAEVDYIISPADGLEISVYGETNLERDLIVRPDGRVSFPLVGDVQVAGKTTAQIKSAVEEKVREYVPDANVSVIVTGLGSLQYYVVGKVANPGTFNMSRAVNVLQALSTAGGLTTFAKEKDILIIRGSGEGTQQIRFNYDEIKSGKSLEQNIVLERGDVVLVP